MHLLPYDNKPKNEGTLLEMFYDGMPLLCSRFYQKKVIIAAPPLPREYSSKDALIRELHEFNLHLLKENERIQQNLERDLEKQFYELKVPEAVASSSKDEEQAAKDDEVILKAAEGISTRKVTNKLYNLLVIFNIPGVEKFRIKAILDTGATSCCINKGSVPANAIESSAFEATFSGVNSMQTAKEKLKGGQMEVEENTFRIPYTYVFPMDMTDGIEMLIGCNFIRSMHGGLRIEGDYITLYKNITRINTSQDVLVSAKAIAELDLDEDEYLEQVYYSKGEIAQDFEKQYGSLVHRLKQQGYIGDEPMTHWAKNKVKCKLEIINPDLTIQDKPLKHVTPAMKVQFSKHIEALKKLKVIRPSTSRHRTMAMIVHSGTTVDPTTGKETRGKERLVFNYRTLNDNTYKDQYSLPGINTIIQRIGQANIFSKFDLKSGFHQVAMEEESIPWTAFICTEGLFEWLVMPLGLKNAPAIFQRKMDVCFAGTEEFIAVYIDDILVFSKNKEQHYQHLIVMLKICEEYGLVLSPTKMKVAVTEIDFLGATIGEKKIKLQPHIIKKIVDFDVEKLKEKKGLRSWLGTLNYARNYIPNLGKLLGPLYEKTSEKGDKRFKPSDYELVRKIKGIVNTLPDLEIPPEGSYIVLETDGCMEGWGGICKWKKNKNDPRGSEKVCAYASGKFDIIKSTIDAEIHACMKSLEALKIYYLDQKEITLRTDCQAIISFYNKTSANKPSRVRWMSFTDFITGSGVQINFEHIEGKQNGLADCLSRLVCLLLTGPEPDQEEATSLKLAWQEVKEAEELGIDTTPLLETYQCAVTTLFHRKEFAGTLSCKLRDKPCVIQDILRARWIQSRLKWQNLYIHKSVQLRWKIAYTGKCWKWRRNMLGCRRPKIIGLTTFFQISTMPPRKQPNMKSFLKSKHGQDGLVSFLQPDILRAVKSVRKKRQGWKLAVMRTEDVSSDVG